MNLLMMLYLNPKKGLDLRNETLVHHYLIRSRCEENRSDPWLKFFFLEVVRRIPSGWIKNEPTCTISSPTPNGVLQTSSPKIAEEEANIPNSYRTSLSQLRSCFYSFLHSYRVRIGPVPSVHILSCPSHPTPLTERALWERPRLTFELHFGIPFFDL